MVDASDSNSLGASHAGSSPASGTTTFTIPIRQSPGSERVTRLDGAGLVSGGQPALALFRCAVREAVGHRGLPGIGLQRIVADLLRGVDGFLNVTLFERSEFVCRLARPDGRDTVGLMFDTEGVVGA